MRFSKRTVLFVSLALISALAAGCGSSSKNTLQQIKSAHKLIFCSDITYPPEESYKGTTAVGSDIDIGKEIAKRIGDGTATFDNTTFGSIITALQTKKCDAIISGMNDTASRRKQVSFVDYISVGQSFMVKAGNPLHISTVKDLAGKAAGVESATTNATFLKDQSSKLKATGKSGISVVTYPKDSDAALALKTGKIDAYFADAPVVALYVSKDPSSFTFGGQVVNALPVGIAIRKKDTSLRDAIKKAVDAMYSDGTMKTILARWKMTSTALKT